MKEEADTPAWLATARAAWPRGEAPSGLDAKWSPYWINKFLVYVRRRNGGRLPERCPRPGLAEAFCRFIGTQWEIEGWKVEQARLAAKWLLEASRAKGAERRAKSEEREGESEAGPASHLGSEECYGVTGAVSQLGSEGGFGLRADADEVTAAGSASSSGQAIELRGDGQGATASPAGAGRVEAADLPPVASVLRAAGVKGKWEHVVRVDLRRKHRAYKTEQDYLGAVRRMQEWWRRQGGLGEEPESREEAREAMEDAISFYLDWLSVERGVAAPTQRAALNALIFAARAVFGDEIGELREYRKGRPSKNLPVVLTRSEMKQFLPCVEPRIRQMVELMYGSGARVSEVTRLRVKDLLFEEGAMQIRKAKGGKDRHTTFPQKLHEPLRRHLEGVRRMWEQDMAEGRPGVYLPHLLARKYPNASKEWIWQYVFPSATVGRDPRSGLVRRHHVSAKQVQRAVRQAALRCGVPKRITSHTMRHSYATHLLEGGYDIRTVQELLGHKSVETTMIYTHVMARPGMHVRSPLDGEKEL